MCCAVLRSVEAIEKRNEKEREQMMEFYFFFSENGSGADPPAPWAGEGRSVESGLLASSNGYPEERDPSERTLSGRATLRAVNRNRGLNVCLPALDFSWRV